MNKVGKITIDDFEEKYRRLVEILGVDKTIELSREFVVRIFIYRQ